MAERVILSEDEIRRALVRMSHEIVERGGVDDLILIGVRTRGFPLAKRMALMISEITSAKVPVGALDFTLYRDDLGSVSRDMTVNPSDMPARIADRRVILVDDVLFTGRSVRAAMDALIDWGRPLSIRLAVLIDRGHREMPIRADFVGKNIPSSAEERVQVRLREVDGRDEVAIIRGSPVIASGGDTK